MAIDQQRFGRFVAALRKEKEWTQKQLAEQIHLSRITIRRYMNYMVDTGELVSDIDYKTGGRPSIRYRYGKSAPTNERSGNETSA